MNRRILVAASTVLGVLTPLLAAAENGLTNFMGSTNINQVSRGKNKPVDRGYIVPKSEAIPGGARVSVEIFHRDKNSPVSLTLQIAVNDGRGNVEVIPLKKLSDNVTDNPSNYYSLREFDLSYSALNKRLSELSPNSNLKVGPGTPLFVYARFESTGHQWGGVDRGGIVFMPEDKSQASTAPVARSAKARRAEDLDIAYPISANMAAQFSKNPNKGLQTGGQIRSRVESEGKFQVTLEQLDQVKKDLFELANDPVKAAKVLGPDWTLSAQLRYMKKDKNGNLRLDKQGLPIPDPMIDTYYDNKNFDAAKNDMAIRYRWTEGNASGAWNFKPGLTMASDEGVVDRLEFGVDTTDDKPETIAAFADSHHPLNPFRAIRKIVPGSAPSEFLLPSAKVTDTRYKFELKHANGLIIEVSLDSVLATSLRGKAGSARFAQLEMDIDHLATASTNVAQGSGLLASSDLDSLKPWLKRLGGKAFVDGRPVLHDVRDLEKTSPVKEKHAGDFKVAGKAIAALRNTLLGENWLPGSQKYSLSAFALGLTEEEVGGSVRSLLELEVQEKDAGKTYTLLTTTGRGCGSAFSSK